MAMNTGQQQSNCICPNSKAYCIWYRQRIRNYS